MFFALPFPPIDPVIVSFGPFAIRWYGLAYLAGLLLGVYAIRKMAEAKSPHAVSRQQAEDLLVWMVIGVIAGGRLGFALFYEPSYYLAHPLEVITGITKGGMSFHGGLLGVISATIIYARRHGIQLLPLADLVACASPIGLFFGRIANFINGEHFGHVSDVPWAVYFPRGGDLPRHPSQIYEAALEGLVLFIVLHLLWRQDAIREKPGILTGVFLIGYGLARISLEFVRIPDGYIGFLTIGQALSIPMIVVGLGFIAFARRKRNAP